MHFLVDKLTLRGFLTLLFLVAAGTLTEEVVRLSWTKLTGEKEHSAPAVNPKSTGTLYTQEDGQLYTQEDGKSGNGGCCQPQPQAAPYGFTDYSPNKRVDAAPYGSATIYPNK
jgi:hypothetical protein